MIATTRSDLLDQPLPWVLVPVQTKVREFVGKVLLAAVAAESGWGTVLGSHLALRPALGRFPPSVVLDYSVTPRFAELFRDYRRHGHCIAATEEEGLYGNPMQALADVDVFLAWGPVEQSRAWATGGIVRDCVHATGNPRFDLLRPELRALHVHEADALRERLGRYILVNTNFVSNALFGSDRLASVNLQDADAFSVPVEYFESIERHSIEMQEHFVRMLRVVAEHFPGYRIVLRPHPIEDQEWWRATLDGVENAHVEYSGTVLPWIVGADAVVHNSCTTGIEAHLLGASVFAYVPETSAPYEWSLPNLVSHQAPDLATLLAGLERAIEAAAEGRALPPVGVDELAPHVAAMTGPLAAQRMVEALAPLARPTTLQWSRRRRAAAGFDARFTIAKHLVNLALRRTQVPLSLERAKNAGWDAAEVESVLAQLRAVTGRFADVAVVDLARHVVAIGPSRSSSAELETVVEATQQQV